MGQQLAFEGLYLRERGLRQVTLSEPVWVAKARATALALCKAQGYVTSDDLLDKLPLPPGAHVNLVGAVFADGAGGVLRAGGYIPTRRPQGHGRRIIRWVLR